MESLTKRRLTADELDTLLRTSTGLGCRVEGELTDGWFNSVHRVRLDDGRPAVVKLAPPPDVPVLRYERGILATEAMVYRLLATLPAGAVPAPRLLYEGEEFLVLSVLDGIPWEKSWEELTPGASAELRRQLGAITARLHSLAPADGRFGYPAAESALAADDWRTAFTAMVEATLEDADRWQSPLGLRPDELRTMVAEGGHALAEVTEPKLVHFDLWPGNIFVDPAGPRVTGLIDHERAFWGDPAAELVSLAFGGDTGPDSDLVAGHTGAGGRLDFTPALRHRIALYQLYLALLLVVECGPRGYQGEHVSFCRGMVAEAVDRVRALG
ncbi:phosphotransferase family enzyme [Streptomyces sp. TLI_235]|nr:aminoglycoside phosphotransferase family protein [Streptomyces sp. TLI_235]PBC70352.1 phosphotransferase family enzyme [Streptomyces sp. TLI_235]